MQYLYQKERTTAMSQLGEAIGRYHRLLETAPFKDLSWAHELHDRMRASGLAVAGKPVSPVLRPHFITPRQYAGLQKAAESLSTAVERVENIALSTPALLSRMEMLPAEKMLASLDPGYSFPSVTSLLDTHLNNGTVRFVQYNNEMMGGIAFNEALSELFYELAPMKEFRKKHKMTKLGGMKYLLQALLKAYKDFGGKNKTPQVAILEFRQPFQKSASPENVMIAEYFRKAGLPTEIITPDQLEYRDGVLRQGNFTIDVVYRRVKVQEFLVRFDLTHPLLRAYGEGKVCVVNSFRSELTQKKAIFALLTDENITSGFPASERKAIREFIPWTRVVHAAKTTYQDEVVDLPDFILKNRQKLVLKPNDEGTDQGAFQGAEMDDAAWEKALKTASRSAYVVQEVVDPVHVQFPLLNYGHLELREMRVDVHPHSFLGKVQGCTSWLSAKNGFSSLSGLAPTFILEGK